MTHLVPIRGGELPRNLVLIREGVNTLTDEALSQACRRAHELTGIRGFSVLELPAGGFEAGATPPPPAGSTEPKDGRRPRARGSRLSATANLGLSALVGDRFRGRSGTVRTSPRPVLRADPEPGLPNHEGVNMGIMTAVDLIYDPNEVGPDLVVTCLISQSPRAADPTFDPQPSDILLVTDADDEDLRARVVRRAGNQVSVQLIVPELLTAPSSASV